jgi:hypothetical protein
LAAPGLEQRANLDVKPASDQDGDQGATPRQDNGGTVSLIRTYSSFEELWADSVLAVRGVAGSATIEVIEGLPFTLTQLTVTESSDPSAVGTQITIMQTGSTEYPVSGLEDLLIEGEEYLLMLWQFGFAVDEPIPNQYIVTGAQAAWMFTADGQAVPIFPDNGDGAEICRVLNTDDVTQVLYGGPSDIDFDGAGPRSGY